MLFFTHSLFPATRHHTQKFFKISYYNPTTGTFALGWDDIFFVFYWIIVFTGVRCGVIDYALIPTAARLGVDGRKKRIRFAEQAWILIYPTASWCTGMYILYNSDYWLDLHALWRNWPVREMDGLAKWYYLVQFAFWLQQIVVVNIEERRKDYAQMFTHHVITCALIFASYGYHQTRVGTLILCLMDVVDLFLPLAKMLKYLKFGLPCDITFGIFMVTWFIARHVFYGWVCWSVYAHIPQEIRYGCYKGSVETLQGPLPVPNDWDHLTQPFRDPEGLVCWNNNTKWAFLGGLLALQVVLLIWFTMILKVAYKVLSGQSAEDVRSDDEDEEDEKEDIIEKAHMCVEPQAFLEKDVLSTETNMTFQTSAKKGNHTPNGSRPPSKRRNENGHSSGVNLLAHSDRKDLLGRIGCDKGVE